MSTPEAKIKKMVKEVLAEFEQPVAIGIFKVSTLYIETKAPGRSPTPRQDLTIAQVKGAKGLVFVIDGPQGCEELRRALTLIRFSNK